MVILVKTFFVPFFRKNVAKQTIVYLLQTTMLSKSPVSHNASSNNHEDIASNSLSSNVEAQPLVDLCCVICTGDNIEQEATGYLVTSITTGTSKISQQ